MRLGLDGARALVGGGSRGLGGAIADVLAAEGARVAITARPSADLDARAAALGGVAVPADLSAPDGPEGAVRAAVDALGGLDLLVVNSGGPPAGTFDSAGRGRLAHRDRRHAAVDDPRRARRAARPAGQRPRRDLHGAVGLGPGAAAGPVTSNVLRPGLAGLVKSLAEELAPSVRVNAVAPGRISTARSRGYDEARARDLDVPLAEVEARSTATIPLRTLRRPARSSAAWSPSCSPPPPRYVTGQVLPVDGGISRSLP